MKRSEIIERLQSVQEELEVLIDHADEVGDDPEGNIPTNSVFFMPFTDVIRMIKAGLFDLFRVGDQIVTRHSKYGPIVWDIIGKNVDITLEAENTLTLQMHYVLPGAFPYDEESKEYEYGHAHYPTSSIRKFLNTEVISGFDPSDVDCMLPVQRVTYTVKSEGSKPEVTQDKLFLLSSSEVGFPVGDYVNDEGAAYEYYAGNPEKRCKVQLNDQTQARHWWLRSPNPGYANYARAVGTSGAQSYSSAYSGYGAAAACVIG